MEESIKIEEAIAKALKLEEVDPRTYSPLVLAYIGDAVYELLIHTKVINHGSMQVNKMHKKSASLVKAETQANLIKSHSGRSDRGGTGCIQAGPQREIRHHSQARHHDRLPHGHRF